MENKLNLKLLKDSPILSDGKDFYDFYHKYIAPSLHELINNETVVQTIGLFGSWGSGKSTIIKNLEKEYSKQYPVFIFDAWKYHSDPLRRTFIVSLFNFVDTKQLWAKGEKPNSNFLDDLYEDTSVSETEKKEEEQAKSGLGKLFAPITNVIKKHPYVSIVFVGLFISLVSWIAAQYYLSENHPFVAFFLKIPGLIGLSAVATTVIVIVAKQVVETITKLLLDDLRVDVRTQTIIKHREYLNSPEQFENKFKEILRRLDKRIVVVFDNIDRVHGKTAIETLTAIKTFIDPEENDKAVFIVPCDSEAIMRQLTEYYAKDTDPSEYLRKLFNVVVWTPDFINADLEDFTRASIKQIGDKSGLLDKDELILVINHAFRSNPREIKQFINNLLSSIMIASKTEVWDVVKENIPYLAKVLVLRQKYPDAYKCLKDRWYEPERVYENTKNKSLRDFMVNTSIVTVENAEPFIYFKKANQSREIKSSEALTTVLVKGDVEEVEKLIQQNKGKEDKVADFILSLYSQYSSEPSWLTNIFKSHVLVFEKLGIEITQTRYYDRSLELVDGYLWQNYALLPTPQLFKYFIQNTKAKLVLRNKLISRFIAALGSKEVTENKEYAKEIIQHLTQTGVKEEDSLSKLRKIIEEAYALEPSIMSLFDSYELQEKYITSQSIDKFVRSVTYDNFKERLPICIKYKKLINSNNIGSVLIQIINSMMQTEYSQSPTQNVNKQTLFELTTSIIESPDSLLDTTDVANIGTLGNNAVAAYSKTGSAADENYYFIPLLSVIRPQMEEPHRPALDNTISLFIKNANIDVINTKITPKLKELDQLGQFITEYLTAIKERAVASGGESLGELYENATPQEKQEIIISLIQQRPDLGLEYIKTVTELPNRQETVIALLQRLNSIPVTDRWPYYEWVCMNIKQNDDMGVKKDVAAHITSLLRVDSLVESEIGFKLLQVSDFLSETAKREIAKDVIDWLRTPGKVITSNNRFALKAISYLFAGLQQTPQSDFVFIVFELLNKESDKPSLEVAVEILQEIKPKWQDYKKDYADFKEKIVSWTDKDSKNLVIDGLNNLQPTRLTKEQRDYWNSLDQIKNSGDTT